MHGGTCSFAGGTELFWIMKSKQKGSALGKPHRPVLVTGRLAGELPGCRWVELSGRIVGLSWDRVLLVCFSGVCVGGMEKLWREPHSTVLLCQARGQGMPLSEKRLGEDTIVSPPPLFWLRSVYMHLSAYQYSGFASDLYVAFWELG